MGTYLCCYPFFSILFAPPTGKRSISQNDVRVILLRASISAALTIFPCRCAGLSGCDFRLLLVCTRLKSSDVYILDVGSELFVWVGRGSSVEEKKSGIPYAVKFIEEDGRDVAMPASRLAQGYETLAFKS